MNARSYLKTLRTEFLVLPRCIHRTIALDRIAQALPELGQEDDEQAVNALARELVQLADAARMCGAQLAGMTAMAR